MGGRGLHQAQAGVESAVSEHNNSDHGYRLFGTASPGFTESSGMKSKMDYLSHSTVLGLRVGF
jgi:hypothetical protein